MVKELTETEHLKSLIQDPFGNYVIQTAMTVAEPAQHAKLVEGIKPFLYALRNTPYGKRIQNKIMKDPHSDHKRGHPHHGHGAGGQPFSSREQSSGVSFPLDSVLRLSRSGNKHVVY